MTTTVTTAINLALAYRILAMLKMDDLTYTHLSARVPGTTDEFYIYPFGQLFSEVTPKSLLRVNLRGEIIEGEEYQYNATGYAIHGALYQARPDIHAIFHLHTIAGVAVSAMKCGLLPLSQFSFHFYNRIAYYPYNSLIVDPAEEGQKLSRALGEHFVMMLQNHGTLTAGKSIHEALFYTLFLEKACQVQCQVLAGTKTFPILPPHDVCEKACQDMRAFEPDLGKRDWLALCRQVKKVYPELDNLTQTRGIHYADQ